MDSKRGKPQKDKIVYRQKLGEKKNWEGLFDRTLERDYVWERTL